MDELKDIWQKGQIKVKPPDLPDDWENKRQDMAHKILKALKNEHARNLWGLILVSICLTLIQYYLLAIVNIVLIIPILWYLKNLIKKVEELHYEYDVHAYLIELHELMKKFTINYLVVYIVYMPIGFSFGYYYAKQAPSDVIGNWFWISLLISIIITTIGIFIVFYFRYGRHIRKIKKMIVELEEEYSS